MNSRWTAAATSTAVHLLVGLAVLRLSQTAASPALPKPSAPLSFVRLAPLTVPQVTFARARVAAPAAAKAAPPVPVLQPAPPPARPEPERIARAVEPPRPELRQEPAPSPAPTPPMPSKAPVAVVTVGAFASNAAPTRNLDVARPVQAGGFDAPEARASELKIAAARVGGFESAAAGQPQAGTDRPSRAVADAGFGASPGGASAPGRLAQVREVKTTEFDAHAPAPAIAPTQVQQPRAARVDVPVEILSKPTPVYTDEARALKIEGDVLLDVEFSAAGELRVLQVVHGLGHGLDESASRAAAGMRFKPAMSGGRPIDFRATVHIVFRLA